MPVRKKIFYMGGYYHVYSRGIEKRVIFQDRADYQRFLSKAKLYSNEYSFEVLAYCLMPNHYHLLIKQESETSGSVFLQRLNLAYSMYFNKRYERVGPLFQGRFKAKLVETDEYLIHLSRYIHLNPKEILKSKNLSLYKWSSYPFYIRFRLIDPLINKVGKYSVLSYFSRKNGPADYRRFVESEQKTPPDLDELLLE